MKNNIIDNIIKKISNQMYDKILFILLNIWMLSPIIILLVSTLCFKLKYPVWYFITTIVGLLLIIISFMKIRLLHLNGEKLTRKEIISFIMFIIFFIWCVITTIFADDKLLALYGNTYRYEGLVTYLIYFGYILSAFILNNKEYIIKLIKTFIFTAIILVVVELINNNDLFNFLHYTNNGRASIFFQFNHFGYYLMLASISCMFIYLREEKVYKKIIYLILYLLLIYMLVINNTFGSYLGLFIATIIYFIYMIFRRKLNKYIIIIFICFMCFSFLIKNDSNEYIEFKNFNVLNQDTKTFSKHVKNNKTEDKIEKNKFYSIGTNRGLLWETGLDLVKEKPIIGYGIEGISDEYLEHNITIDRPHNILIQMALFTGIPGLIIYISIIGLLFIRKFINIKKLSDEEIMFTVIVGCYIISSMFGNSMFYTTPYFLIYLGFMAKIKNP